MTIKRYTMYPDCLQDCFIAHEEDDFGTWVKHMDHERAVLAKDTEIAELKEQLATLLMVPDENMLHDAEELVKDVDDDEAELIRLRKVVEAVKRWKVAYNERDIREAWDAVSDALAELDKITKK